MSHARLRRRARTEKAGRVFRESLEFSRSLWSLAETKFVNPPLMCRHTETFPRTLAAKTRPAKTSLPTPIPTNEVRGRMRYQELLFAAKSMHRRLGSPGGSPPILHTPMALASLAHERCAQSAAPYLIGAGFQPAASSLHRRLGAASSTRFNVLNE